MHQSDQANLHLVADRLHGKSRLHSKSSIGIDGQSGALLIDSPPGMITGLTGNSTEVPLVRIPAIGVISLRGSVGA